MSAATDREADDGEKEPAEARGDGDAADDGAEDEAQAAAPEPPAKKLAKARKKRKVQVDDDDVEAAAPADDVETAAPAEVAARPAHVVTIAEERAARRALQAGGTLGAIGLSLVGIGPSDAGMAVVLAGLVALVYGIHTFGRLGPAPAKAPAKVG